MNSEIQPIPKTDSPKPQKDGYTSTASFVFDVVEMVAWAVFIMIMIFSFSFRLCRVEGESMENTLSNGQTLLIRNIGYTPKQDDIIVFHLTLPEINMEKTVVKRVIATGGQHVEIDFNTGIIKVDGKVYEDPHKTLKNSQDMPVDRYLSVPAFSPYYDFNTRIFSATVPKGSLFVMGDNRNNSNDSRNPAIGFVDERCILGKVILSLSPLKTFN